MLIKKMKAAVLVNLHAPLEVVELELPDSLSFGQVLVKIHFSGICGAQINEIEGAKGSDKFLPHLLGHEGSATILAIGTGVKTVKVGDRVVMHWRQTNGIQSETPMYRWGDKTVNAGWVTTFCDYAIVSENRLTAIPNNFDLTIAPLFGCAVTTAMGVVNNDAGLKIGQSIVVFGVGGVGLNVVQAAAMVSANPIVGVDILDNKLEMAKSFGATHCINSKRSADLLSEIRNIVGKAGADVVVDNTGVKQVMEQSYELTHPDGKTILVGVPKKGDNMSIDSLPLHFKKVLKGSHGGSSEPHLDIPRYIRLFQLGKLKLDGLVTHTFPLDKINDAIQTVKSGNAGRVLLSLA